MGEVEWVCLLVERGEECRYPEFKKEHGCPACYIWQPKEGQDSGGYQGDDGCYQRHSGRIGRGDMDRGYER